MFNKAGDDFILIHFPDYLRKEPLKLPKGNSEFEVFKTVKMIYSKVIIDEKKSGLENVTMEDFKLYKMNGTECNMMEFLFKYQEPKKNNHKQMIQNFMFDM